MPQAAPRHATHRVRRLPVEHGVVRGADVVEDVGEETLEVLQQHGRVVSG